jgi:hypothetical protein
MRRRSNVLWISSLSANHRIDFSPRIVTNNLSTVAPRNRLSSSRIAAQAKQQRKANNTSTHTAPMKPLLS